MIVFFPFVFTLHCIRNTSHLCTSSRLSIYADSRITAIFTGHIIHYLTMTVYFPLQHWVNKAELSYFCMCSAGLPHVQVHHLPGSENEGTKEFFSKCGCCGRKSQENPTGKSKGEEGKEGTEGRR